MIPLWIGGRAYLTITEAFATVRRAADGTALRRIPLCAAREIDTALRATYGASPEWSLLQPALRERFLAEMANALSRYAQHIASLISEEAGITRSDARSEVRTAAMRLRTKNADGVEDHTTAMQIATQINGLLTAIACDASPHPLTDFLRHAIPAWRSGRSVIARVSADAPSAFFAFAELTAHCHWPAGAFCLLYGDACTDAALKAAACPLIYA